MWVWCDWPVCGLPAECIEIDKEGTPWRLCEAHGDLVAEARKLAENEG